MATRYSYPIDLHREREGGFSVTFPDFDEHSPTATLRRSDRGGRGLPGGSARGRIARREDIPGPSPAKGRPLAVPGAVLAAKTALYEAMREQRLSNSAFAVAMGVQESEVRRMLDPRHATKIGRLEEALARFRKALGDHCGRGRLTSGLAAEADSVLLLERLLRRDSERLPSRSAGKPVSVRRQGAVEGHPRLSGRGQRGQGGEGTLARRSPARGQPDPQAVLRAVVVGRFEPRALEADLERAAPRAREPPAEADAEAVQGRAGAAAGSRAPPPPRARTRIRSAAPRQGASRAPSRGCSRTTRAPPPAPRCSARRTPRSRSRA